MKVKFCVQISRLKNLLSQLEQTEKDLLKYKESLEDIRNTISIGSGTHEIKNQLSTQIEEIKREADSVHQLKEVLEDVIRLYEFTEAAISGEYVKMLAISGDKALDALTDRGKEILDAIDVWVDSVHKKNENVVDRIKDEGTRKGFDSNYQERLQQLYDDVPPEYQSAKNLYDKYSKDVQVADFNTSKSYHSNGKLYINSNGDMNNDRGDGTTYYHEYGHFVVHKEGWVTGNQTNGRFKDFESSLKKEVSGYIQNYEDQFRQEGEDKGLTGPNLNKYVKEETKKAIETDINGVNNEYYHVNNGLSDIIDGVSNDKYQASYGHPEGYWEKNPTRVSNEAFAQIFSAEMTGDTTEIEKMKEIFPETYEIYTDMINNAS